MEWGMRVWWMRASITGGGGSCCFLPSVVRDLWPASELETCSRTRRGGAGTWSADYRGWNEEAMVERERGREREREEKRKNSTFFSRVSERKGGRKFFISSKAIDRKNARGAPCFPLARAGSPEQRSAPESQQRQFCRRERLSSPQASSKRQPFATKKRRRRRPCLFDLSFDLFFLLSPRRRQPTPTARRRHRRVQGHRSRARRGLPGLRGRRGILLEERVERRRGRQGAQGKGGFFFGFFFDFDLDFVAKDLRCSVRRFQARGSTVVCGAGH